MPVVCELGRARPLGQDATAVALTALAAAVLRHVRLMKTF